MWLSRIKRPNLVKGLRKSITIIIDNVEIEMDCTYLKIS